LSAAGLHFSVHDDTGPTDAAAIVDAGLDGFNHGVAPLHEVEALSCYVRDDGGVVIGGAVGRTWGRCCELEQLWVHEDWRRRGIGAALVRRFERRAIERGCSHFYLDTFSFQAPGLYRSLGYEAVLVSDVYPHGIVRYTMHKLLPAAPVSGE
jgi:GNAT superfamily N-acetyltransferase